MSTEESQRLSTGTRVKTTHLNREKQEEWSEEGLASKQWGVKGTVIAVHDSQGLYYDVRHADGTVGCYDESEFQVLS